MKKIAVVYASMSGRNEKIASYLTELMTHDHFNAEKLEISQLETEDLLAYQGLVVVTYTYHDGEVPDEALDFYEDLSDIDLQRLPFAVCGSSSKTHLHFGRAADYFTIALNGANGEQVADTLKIDRDPDEADWQRLAVFSTRVEQAVGK